MKILVAEDEAVSRLLMKSMLEKFGYEVVLAEDGRTAAEILAQGDAPRLALIDWMMPELDGPGLCREVRTNQREGAYVYLLMLTSRQDHQDIVAGLEAGADDYITKPCHPAELKARLHTGRRILSLEDRLVHAREEMRYRATHDALTSLWNRASILSLLRSELKRSTRESKPVALMLCDLDHFKRINDNHGHLVGDAVLGEVAMRLTSSVRGYDAVGRYGGEEFLIVLSDCGSKCLETRAEAVRAAIASTPIRIDGTSLSATISIGATICEDANSKLPIETILAQADAALYRAKAGGRNRTVIANRLVPAQVAPA